MVRPGFSGKGISIPSGSYLLAGVDPSLKIARKLAAAAGSFALTGADATLTKSGSSSLLLDGGLATTANRAYSMRKLRTAYAGSAIRVRRSNDDAEANIGFDGSGNLDTAALATHVGANSGFIVTVFDQSENGVDATQATTSKQPRIRNSGTTDTKNSLPCPFFVVGDQTELATGLTSFTAAETAVITAVNLATFDQFRGVIGSTSNGDALGLVGSNGTTSWLESGGALSDTVDVNNTGSEAAVMSGTLQQVSARGTAATFVAANIGDDRANGRHYNGWIGEVIIWPSQLSVGDRLAVYTDQKTYWGTP